MLGAFTSMCITLGLLGLALYCVRRWVPGARPAGCAVPMELLRRVSTGPKQGVGLFRVGDRVLLLSLGEEGARLLTEIDGADRALALGAGPSAESPDFSAALASAPAFGGGQAGVPGRARQPLAAVLRKALPFAIAFAVLAPAPAHAATPVVPVIAALQVQSPTAPKVTVTIGQGSEQLQLTGAVGIVIFMGAMTLLPAIFLLMTSFTRILIVLHFVRTAIGTQTAPPGQLLVALAVLLTGVVMTPVMERANTEAIQPYLNGQISQTDAYHKAIVPLRQFMLDNTREKDLGVFAELTGQENADSLEALPTLTITAAFVTSELRTAFQMGFVIFLPFVVVDLIVASVLMSMGMFMLPPVMISLPFKLMLFVLADGWSLVVQKLVTGFQT
jgi:flagellar biosynthetic protein FliP